MDPPAGNKDGKWWFFVSWNNTVIQMVCNLFYTKDVEWARNLWAEMNEVNDMHQNIQYYVHEALASGDLENAEKILLKYDKMRSWNEIWKELRDNYVVQCEDKGRINVIYTFKDHSGYPMIGPYPVMDQIASYLARLKRTLYRDHEEVPLRELFGESTTDEDLLRKIESTVMSSEEFTLAYGTKVDKEEIIKHDRAKITILHHWDFKDCKREECPNLLESLKQGNPLWVKPVSEFH
ncbi:hypothetical protein [Metallosphaera hakonensis]|uniref:hypothetical protein n=1 Tax=Metallosphaera hakonensis TaxID=79601 RepID=UPI0006D194C7|nr:hypothetical protein [Metallosphaera hakonensis]